MDIGLFISLVGGLFFICLLIAVIVVMILWIIKVRRIKRKIPEELKGGKNAIKEKEEEYRRIKEEVNREKAKLQRGFEEAGDSNNDSYSKGRRGIPILPSKQLNKPKRKPKEDWPSFE